MSDLLRVRVYNVRFGDALLVTVPDRNPTTGKTIERKILIDVGNAPLVASREGGDDAAFQPVIDDILDQLGGRRLDLYVLTHEHLDHAQGLAHAAWKLFPPGEFTRCFKVSHVWLTASAAPGYYEQPEHAEARRRKLEADRRLAAIGAYLEASEPEPGLQFAAYLTNNDPTKTSQCVEFVRGLNPRKTHYIHREANLRGKHPFREARLSVWAPEENTADYYGRFQPLSFGVPDDPAAPPVFGPPPSPPAGVDLGAFLRLVETRRSGIADDLLTIDAAANNTSIVLLLEWRGWRLLFPGDAEIRSWRTMHKLGLLAPVHFLKVAHHGSHNGTPTGDVFDAILPARPPDRRRRIAAISTWTDTYPGIPDRETNERLLQRCRLRTTLDRPEALYYDVTFRG